MVRRILPASVGEIVRSACGPGGAWTCVSSAHLETPIRWAADSITILSVLLGHAMVAKLASRTTTVTSGRGVGSVSAGAGAPHPQPPAEAPADRAARPAMIETRRLAEAPQRAQAGGSSAGPCSRSKRSPQ